MSDASNAVDFFQGLQTLLEASLPNPLRPWLGASTLAGLRGALVLGPRGVGKSTQLLHLAQEKGKFLYVSVDNIAAAGISLSAMADEAFSRGYEGVIFDEVHEGQEWAKHLKSIYDSAPRKFVWASDSNASVLRVSSADLSRRFPRVDVPYLSFREYLALVNAGSFTPVAPFQQDARWAKGITSKVNVLAQFQNHLEGGMRPLFLEGSYGPRLLATLEKTIHADIPAFVPQIQDQNFRLLKAVVRFLAQSPVPTVNVEGLCREWAIGKEKLYTLLDAMENVGILNVVRYASDRSAMSKGAKMLLADPSLYSVLRGNEGTMREAYVVTMARAAGLEVHAHADETHADFVIDGRSVEVGGRTKQRKKADVVVRAGIELPSPGVLPLWCVGFWH